MLRTIFVLLLSSLSSALYCLGEQRGHSTAFYIQGVCNLKYFLVLIGGTFTYSSFLRKPPSKPQPKRTPTTKNPSAETQHFKCFTAIKLESASQ